VSFTNQYADNADRWRLFASGFVLAPTVAALVGGGGGVAAAPVSAAPDGQTSSQKHATWKCHVEDAFYSTRL
jgi:hypothetical protein